MYTKFYFFNLLPGLLLRFFLNRVASLVIGLLSSLENFNSKYDVYSRIIWCVEILIFF